MNKDGADAEDFRRMKQPEAGVLHKGAAKTATLSAAIAAASLPMMATGTGSGMLRRTRVGAASIWTDPAARA